jgi:hypothetical protein
MAGTNILAYSTLESLAKEKSFIGKKPGAILALSDGGLVSRF